MLLLLRVLTHLHCVVQKLVLELLDPEDLLEEVVQLLLVEHFVAQHGRGRSLTRTSRLLLCGKAEIDDQDGEQPRLQAFTHAQLDQERPHLQASKHTGSKFELPTPPRTEMH